MRNRSRTRICVYCKTSQPLTNLKKFVKEGEYVYYCKHNITKCEKLFIEIQSRRPLIIDEEENGDDDSEGMEGE